MRPTACSAGSIEDLPLEPWLRQVWKAEGAILNRDTVRLGATLGFAEQLLGGVTTVMDMFWHPRETVAAARASGLRVATGGIFFDGVGVDGKTVAERVADAEAFFADFAGAEDVLPGCFPHGAYTVGPEGLAGGLAAGGGEGRALLHPCRGDARRAGRHRGALRAAGDPAPRPPGRARRAHGAGALRLARRRGDRDPGADRRHGVAQPGVEPEARERHRAGARHAGGGGAGHARDRRRDLGQRPRPVDGAAAGGDAAPGRDAPGRRGDDGAGAADGDARRRGGARGGGPAGVAGAGQARRHDPDRPAAARTRCRSSIR